jgi:hypothetical protein
MSQTKSNYTGDGVTVLYSITFPYLQTEHIKASINGTPTTDFVFANATTVQFNVAPANGADIVLFRDTPIDELENKFFPNSSITSSSLNENFTQGLYVAQETNNTSQDAFSAASTAVTTANGAVATANQAAIDASAAVVTANQAEINSLSAVSVANLAESNSIAAVNTANLAESNSLAAISTANSAVAAVAAAVIYQPVVDLAALALLSPSDGEFFELQDSTGADTDPSITGIPVGLVGDTGLVFRLRYDDPPGEYVFLGYFSSDSETRYIKSGVGAIVDADVSTTADIDPTKIFGVAVVDNDSRLTDERVPTDGSVTDAKVDANAAIAGTKISPDFGSQNIVTTGDVSAQDAVFSGDAQAASINGGPLAGMRNAIINGNFDVWQRGTSFTGAEYTADRWIMSRGNTTATASRQSFTLGQTDVPGEPRFFWRCVTSSVAGAGNFVAVLQPIEGVRTFAGQQVTVSFWAKADASKPISIELRQAFGTGGSPSVDVPAIGVTKTTLSTSWQKITATVTVPSIAGKTLGSGGNDRLDVIIWFDAGSNFDARTDSLGQQSGTFDIAQVQVEAGPVATPFERRPIGTELSLCYRYCFRSFFESTVFGGDRTHGNNFFFPVPLRTAPTVTFNNRTTNVGNLGTWGYSGTFSSGRIFNSDGNWTVSSIISATIIADAEL